MNDNVDENAEVSNSSKSNRRKLFIGVIGAVAFLCCGIFAIGIFVGDSADDQVSELSEIQEPVVSQLDNVVDSPELIVQEEQATLTPLPTDEPLPTNTIEPTETPLPTETPDPNLIRQGTYLVGADIQPGLYRGIAGTDTFDSCYWARLSDLTGSFDAILANDNSIGQYYIEVLDSDLALETQCEISFLPEPLASVDSYPQVIVPGAYLVGAEIEPSIYRGEAGIDPLDSCYWARLSDFSGDFNSLITNDNAIGQYYVEVRSDDYALQTQCELVSLKSLPEPSTEYPNSLTPGTYIVGRDIQAGTYRGEAGADILESCYWARLKDLSGDFSSLLANDNSNGQYFIQVLESDFALEISCELEFVQD